MRLFCYYEAMKYKRIINPLVPKSRTNPTGTNRILSAADKDISARYKRIADKVLAWFDSVPWLAFNAEGAYAFPATRMDELRQVLAEITTSELVDGQPLTFFFAEYEDDSARLGLAQASANLSAMSATYAATRPMYAVMATDAYRNRVAMAKQRSYTHFTGLSDALQADLAQVIAYGIQNGQNPRALAGVIRDRLGVSESRARMYAQSEIPGTLRDVTLAEGDDAAEALGIEIKYLWTSALIPTTRPWHASRHGRLYTSEEIRTFYSKGGERYNCLCAATSVLIEDGVPQLTQKLKATYVAEKTQWEKAHG